MRTYARNFEVLVGAALAVLTVTTMGVLMHALFNVSIVA